MDAEAPYIKILALWKVNVEQSTADLTRAGHASWLTIRYEDLVREPRMTTRKIYSLWDGEPPSEVVNNACGRAVFDLGGHNKWQSRISDEWLLEWQQVGFQIWEKGIQTSGISQTMKRLGYE